MNGAYNLIFIVKKIAPFALLIPRRNANRAASQFLSCRCLMVLIRPFDAPIYGGVYTFDSKDEGTRSDPGQMTFDLSVIDNAGLPYQLYSDHRPRASGPRTARTNVSMMRALILAARKTSHKFQLAITA
jgi:hypothetical protein